MGKGKYIAGVVQMNSRDNKKENLQQAVSLIEEAVARGARLIALPEMMNYHGKDFVSAAEDMPGGETFMLMSETAKKYRVWLNCGSIFEKNPNDEQNRPYNSCMLISPDGKLAAKYRKLHLFDVNIGNGGKAIKESSRVSYGNMINVVDAGEFGMLGLSVCYDIRFPELYRLLALKGAEVLFVPASFQLMTGKDHWETLLRARAIENSCYVIAPAQIGKKIHASTYGKSIIIDPWGNVLASAPDKTCLITAEIDLDYCETVRNQLAVMENRRKDLYFLSYSGEQY